MCRTVPLIPRATKSSYFSHSRDLDFIYPLIFISLSSVKNREGRSPRIGSGDAFKSMSGPEPPVADG